MNGTDRMRIGAVAAAKQIIAKQDAALANERRLLAEVSRWARTNGWYHLRGGYVNADATARITPEADGFIRWQRDGDRWFHNTHSTGGVRQAIDVLVALDVLPPQFSSAYEAGLDSASEVVDAARTWSKAERRGSGSQIAVAAHELHDAIGCYDNREDVTR